MELDSKCEGGGKHRHKVRIDVVAYNKKRRMMLDDRRSDKDCLLDRNEFHQALYRGSCFPR